MNNIIISFTMIIIAIVIIISPTIYEFVKPKNGEKLKAEETERKCPKYVKGHYVQICFLSSNGRWKHDYLNTAQNAKYDRKNAIVVDSLYIEDKLSLYKLKVSDKAELIGIPEDCITSI